MKRIACLFAAVIVLLVLLASSAEAHHGVVAFRNTPLNPFRGPVPVRNAHRADFFVAPHNFVVPFRSSYSLPFDAAPVVAPYYAPPATVIYSQPAPVVSTYQSYSASGYGTVPQAFSAGGQVYVLPDGRTVLPDGRVINP